MTIPKRELDRRERTAGAISTPLKHLSTLIDGPNAWKDTGCEASGTWRPVRQAQHSTDGFYTVDVAIAAVEVNGVRVPSGRFVRLEVMPGTAAHRSVRRRLPQPTDIIAFNGPLVSDKDKDADHPGGHMEIHPIAAIQFLTAPSGA